MEAWALAKDSEPSVFSFEILWSMALKSNATDAARLSWERLTVDAVVVGISLSAFFERVSRLSWGVFLQG